MYYFLILFVVTLVHGHINEYNYVGYKIFKIEPKSKEQLGILERYLNNPKYDVWSHTRLLNISWVIMVSPFQVKDVEHTLKLNKFDFKEIKSNFRNTSRRKGMNNNDLLENDSTYNLHKNGSMKINIRSKRATNFIVNRYYTYNAMKNYMYELERKYPDKVTVIMLGRTYENQELLGLKISTGSQKKPAILIDAGIHAREWIAPPVALHIIKQLTENSNYDHMTHNVDWYIFPLLNPDGYEYSATHDRMWRKTRSKGEYCTGVDANRNWNFHWSESGQISFNECDEIYVGPYPFSEPETSHYSEFVYHNRHQIKVYISFHSYGSLILYPWGYTKTEHENVDQLHQLGERVSQAIYDFAGTSYRVGSSSDILYEAAGSSYDWMAGVAEIPFSYTIELPGFESEFNPPTSKIKEVVDEMFEGIKIFHEHVEENYN